MTPWKPVAGPPGTIPLTIDGAPAEGLQGRSLLAALLSAGTAPAFTCAIGQCQRCLVRVDGVPRLACLTYPSGGETITTELSGKETP